MTAQQRLRISFGKGNSIKYISHLDLHATWERAFRRAGIPLAYSQGFNPQAKLQLAAALPVGYTGRAELMDIFLDTPLTADMLEERLKPNLPAGLTVASIEEVDLKAPSLQASLAQAEYVVTMEQPGAAAEEIQQRVAQFLEASTWEQQRQRKGRMETIDLRPLVLCLTIDEPAQSAESLILRMRVVAGQAANVRPDTVLEALGLPTTAHQTDRTELVFGFD